jgi:hypothetical protein
MMQVVWIVVGVGALLLLAVLGYGLFAQLKRLRGAIGDMQTSGAPQVAELAEGIRTAQRLRMQDGADRTWGHGQHA